MRDALWCGRVLVGSRGGGGVHAASLLVGSRGCGRDGLLSSRFAADRSNAGVLTTGGRMQFPRPC